MVRTSGWSVLIAMLGLSLAPAPAQGPLTSIAFRNETPVAVIVQGISIVNGMLRRGQPLLVVRGRAAGDFNVPAGLRVYSVYDANQPSRVLVKDQPVNVVQGRNLSFAIRSRGPQFALVSE